MKARGKGGNPIFGDPEIHAEFEAFVANDRKIKRCDACTEEFHAGIDAKYAERAGYKKEIRALQKKISALEVKINTCNQRVQGYRNQCQAMARAKASRRQSLKKSFMLVMAHKRFNDLQSK